VYLGGGMTEKKLIESSDRDMIQKSPSLVEGLDFGKDFKLQEDILAELDIVTPTRELAQTCYHKQLKELDECLLNQFACYFRMEMNIEEVREIKPKTFLGKLWGKKKIEIHNLL
jgi:hypothetical protein